MIVCVVIAAMIANFAAVVSPAVFVNLACPANAPDIASIVLIAFLAMTAKIATTAHIVVMVLIAAIIMRTIWVVYCKIRSVRPILATATVWSMLRIDE